MQLSDTAITRGLPLNKPGTCFRTFAMALGESDMKREQVRDQLLAPVLQWTRLGRQANKLMVGSMEVISYRSSRLFRGATLREQHDWPEMGLMAKEKIAVPIEAAVAMTSALQSETQQFVSEIGQATLTVAGSMMALATSRSTEEFGARQLALGEAMIGAALSWYQVFGRAAEVAEQGLRPILRQVTDNAERLS
jgi:hypothetical protein